MTREQVMTVVVKHLAEAVDGLDPANIDASRSMKDLGANSLDIVEVVSSSMRELKIKIPRSELAKLTNLDGLVDLLFRTVQESQTQAKAP
ncbi:MAG: acyl carrier protein [Polyangiaceae bacterium]|nr:acyl carrier protein [Polyangiaceae bacterium]